MKIITTFRSGFSPAFPGSLILNILCRQNEFFKIFVMCAGLLLVSKTFATDTIKEDQIREAEQRLEGSGHRGTILFTNVEMSVQYDESKDHASIPVTVFIDKNSWNIENEVKPFLANTQEILSQCSLRFSPIIFVHADMRTSTRNIDAKNILYLGSGVTLGDVKSELSIGFFNRVYQARRDGIRELITGWSTHGILGGVEPSAMALSRRALRVDHFNPLVFTLFKLYPYPSAGEYTMPGSINSEEFNRRGNQISAEMCSHLKAQLFNNVE